ncbi:NADH dehydrogenase [Caballeronia hypogeia]|uniref:NADH dehydrogenase n=1 Tax=Caballeronia hypogeia TaxID=1777140 RepID=A0A158CCA8_9BURK|nr:NAD(P)/FAD-dependent oxidoreductase [Caballeronia hypogeia]SAK79939.1 NADH dehydrogenase [Caballeronia hypogeia]
MHRIVIVGGGAGGLELATRLGDTMGREQKALITLVDACPTHVWKPLLHEVAAGSLDVDAHQIEYAAQAHWHHFSFALGEMVELDSGSRRLRLSEIRDDERPNEVVLPTRWIEYDTLVLALGSRTHSFGISGAETHAVTMDTLEQAERLRKRLLHTCVRNNALKEAGLHRTVKIAIIGGGATGVELAGELRRMEESFRKFGLHASEPTGDFEITVFEAGTRILPALPERISAMAQQMLQQLGVSVSLSDPIVEVSRDQIRTRSGHIATTDIVIWAAGIKAPAVLGCINGLAVNHINQVTVDGKLRSVSDDNIFALGDCASCSWTNDRSVPPRAQAAHQQAVYLAKAISARARGMAIGDFHYTDYGSLVSLGSSKAIGHLIGGFPGASLLLEGGLAKLMYTALYQKHRTAISGLRRTIVDVLAHRLRRMARPRVKLH